MVRDTGALSTAPGPSYTGRVIERERALLFFDDQYLDRRENLERRVGRPSRVEEGSFRDPLRTIRIYSSASESEHARLLSEPELGEGSLLLHELRRDGFVYLEPPGGPGSLTTRRLYLRGAEVAINVQAPHGRVRVQVTDGSNRPLAGYSLEECVPFTGDATAWQPRWREGRTVAALQDQVIHLELELSNGRLFAIRGDLPSVTSVEYRRWLSTGEQPTAMLEA